MLLAMAGAASTGELGVILARIDVPPGTVPLPMLDLEPPVALEVGAS